MSHPDLPPVLSASVHDVRYFAALLRGVNFANRATVTIAKIGLTITVEEARTLLGTAFVFSDVFDEYAYNPESLPEPVSSQNSDDSEEPEAYNATFEVPLNTLIECLNIFGTAGPVAASSASSTYKRWQHADDQSDHEGDDNGGRNRPPRANGTAGGRIDQYFGADKGTRMRMTFVGPGYPLILLVAEDASGPTTTCEITTFESEPHLQLDFNNDDMILKIILKSSWLRDALSEIDPSCDKLTFISNPPAQTARDPRNALSKPMLRIQAVGTFGSTELDYPNDRDVLETFECAQTIRFSYRFGHIARTLRALQSSTKTSLRIDKDGLLSLQFLMPSPKPRGGNSAAFIEFRCLALDEDL